MRIEDARWSTTMLDPPSFVGSGSGSVDPSVKSRPSTQTATICQVLHGLAIGGAEVLSGRLARQLKRSYRFLFVCLDELGPLGESLREEGFPVHTLDRRPGLDWRCMRLLRELCRREKVDLIHAHQYTPFFYSSLCRGFGANPPVLFTEHGRHHPDYPRRKRILANKLLLRRSDRAVAVGQAVRQALIDNEGIAPDQVNVIYNGVPLERFNTGLSRDEWLRVRAEIGLEPDELALIQVARLDYLKDHATAIRTVENLLLHKVGVKLVLVGEGPERGAIQDMVRQRGLEKSVLLLGLRSDVPRLLAASDIALLTSISEGIPLTLIEAMAARLPVVATRVGGIAEVVNDGQTALLAPAGDDAALAEQILRLAKAPGQRSAMGRLGRERAEAVFAEQQMHDRYRMQYAQMLSG